MESAELDIIRKVHDLFLSKRLKLSAAESCTGGYLAHMITSIPGASAFFDSSIVCYSVQSKEKLLGVKNSVIEKSGVISEETARAMAEGAMKATGADVSVAITGNAGPDAIGDVRVGIVFIAVATGVETTSRGYMFDGTREEIKRSASEAALHLLYEAASLWE